MYLSIRHIILKYSVFHSIIYESLYHQLFVILKLIEQLYNVCLKHFSKKADN